MSHRFIQIHMLTVYPFGNPNRDDMGRPKSGDFGGVPRGRISSQCLKRTWRTNNIAPIEGGTRTKKVALWIYEALKKEDLGTVDPAKVQNLCKVIAAKFGHDTLVYLADGEILAAQNLARDVIKCWNGSTEGPVEEAKWIRENLAGLIAGVEADTPKESGDDDGDGGSDDADTPKKAKGKGKAKGKVKETKIDLDKAPANVKSLLDSMFQKITSIDISMFGRMLAKSPAHNVDAAVQVAHAMTTHRATFEDDYWTGVDDMNHLTTGEEDAHKGSAHIGEATFTSGVFYSYVVIDRKALIENLGGGEGASDAARNAAEQWAATGITNLMRAMALVTPTGKQNSFATRSMAGYMLVEKGSATPRSLVSAFLDPVRGPAGVDFLRKSIIALENTKEQFDQVYGCETESLSFNVPQKRGTLDDVLAFVKE